MSLVLGRDATTQQPVRLSDYGRGLGTYVIGLTGTGKTTLLLNAILQDSAAGDGLCVLDPHGDLTQDILERMPSARLDDVILWEPFETEQPFGLNLFECRDIGDANLVDRISSEVMGTFYKLFANSWGPQMEDLLRVSALTLIYNQALEPAWQRPTMAELPRLFTDEQYRAFLVERLPQSEARSFWERTYNPLGLKDGRPSRDMLEYHRSSLNKVRRFLLNTTIRNIVGQATSSFDLRQMMDTGQILLCNLSKGRLGEDNSALLGSVIVGKVLIAALSRADTPRAQRKAFHLYVDEYQSFATSSFPTFQAEARKFNIDTMVAHQYREQLDDSNRGSTLTVGNKVLFRVNGMDADELAKEFDNTPPPPEKTMQPLYRPYGKLSGAEPLYIQHDSPDGVGSVFREVELPRRAYSDVEGETANKLATLAQYTARCKMVTETGALVEHTLKTLPPAAALPDGERRIEQVRQHSRQQYGRARAVVEHAIGARGELGQTAHAQKFKEYEDEET